MRMMSLVGLLAIATSCGGITQEQLDEVNERLEECEESSEECSDELARMQADAEERLADFRKLLKEVEPLERAGVADLEVVDGRPAISIGADILFASGSADLSGPGKEHLATVSRILSKRTSQDFQVQGHTDDDPVRSAQYPTNWHLAAMRAVNVVQFMLQQGMPKDRISAASFGAERPVVPNSSEANKLRNRRIEIVLMPDLASLPGYDELMEEWGRGKRDSARGRGGKAGKAGKAGRGGKAGKAGKAGRR